MSDPLDPIEDWLGTDIELLPPPHGAFERIHRRARRRKTVVAVSAAAGAAVAIAAAATLPQLVSTLQPGHGGGPENVGPVASSSHSPRVSQHHSSTPTPRTSPATSQPAHSQSAQSNLSITTSTQPPTPGISPSSVTFVSGTVGAVIGETTSGCPAGPVGCEAVAGTSDYGQTWSEADAPPARPPDGDSGVSQIRFLQANNGWAYGPGLYVTHNGGATWAKASGVHGRVIDLATVNGSAYAVVASCTGTGSDYAAGCTNFALYTSPYYLDNFQQVAGASGNGQEQPGGLQLTNESGYLLAGDVLFSGLPDVSGSWHAIKISSGAVPACLAANGHRVAQGESGLLAPNAASDLYLLCQPAGGGGGSLYTSTDSGATWHSVGHVTVRGAGTSLAIAPTSGTLVLATSAGIYFSTDTRHWHGASLSGPAPAGGFGYVGMTTPTHGVAVPAGRGSTVIYVTIDGGLTWKPRHIS